MTHVAPQRVWDTSNTTGTGSLTLAGVTVSGHRTLAAGVEQARTIVLLQDRVATLKAIVYGAVVTVLLGVVGTAR